MEKGLNGSVITEKVAKVAMWFREKVAKWFTDKVAK